MPLGGFNQNWSPVRRQFKEKVVEVEKIIEVVVEKIIIDPHVEERVKEALLQDILCLELFQKELRVCNDILDDLTQEVRMHE